MKERKLFCLLKSLSKEEFKGLRKAILSPVYSTNPKVIALFDTIRGKYPDFDNSPNAKKKIFAKVYPNEFYNDQKLRRVFSDTSQVVEEYLIYLELRHRSYNREKVLTQALGRRNLFELFELKTKALLADLEKSSVQNDDYFLKKIQLNKDLYNHTHYNKYDIQDNTLEDISESLDRYFALSKVQLSLALKNKIQVFKKSYNFRFLDVVRQESENGLLEGNSIFKLYLNAMMLAEEDANADFEDYEESLFENLENISPDDQRVLFFNGLNYAIRLGNRGNQEWNAVIFKWLRLGLEKKLFFQNGQLSEATFGNVVIYGCKQNEFDWTEAFIRTHSQYLNSESVSEEVAFCRVILSFYKKQFDSVIHQISNYSFSVKYVLRTESILIWTCFELFLTDFKYYEILHNNLRRIENYFIRNDFFTEKQLAPCKSFLRIIKGLSKKINLGEEFDSLRIWVKSQTEKRGVTVGKQWLTEKYKL